MDLYQLLNWDKLGQKGQYWKGSPRSVADSELIKALKSNALEIVQSIQVVHAGLAMLRQHNHNDALIATGCYNQLVLLLLQFSVSNDDFDHRIEGNALTAFCLRNGPLEDAHADNDLSNARMKEINIWSSRTLSGALALRDVCYETSDGRRFWEMAMCTYHALYCKRWDRKFVAQEIREEQVELIANLLKLAEGLQHG